MAETIFLSNDHFSSKSLNGAIDNVSSAVSQLNKLDAYGAMANAQYYQNGVGHQLFPPAMSEQASAYARELEKQLAKLKSLAAILNSGPGALEEIDQSYKQTKNWLQIISSALGGGGIIGVINRYLENKTGKTLWQVLFGGRNNTGGQTSVISDTESIEEPEIAIDLNNQYESSPTYKYWGITEEDISEIERASTSEQEAKEKLDRLLKAKLDAATDAGTKTDTSRYPQDTRYDYYDPDGIYREKWGSYTISGGCTWYAFNRYREMNGKDLLFHGAGGGNANTWDDRIDTDQFDKISTSGNCSGITNAIAVDNEGSPINGVYYGHVAYVEAIIGDDVYMSEGWYSGGAFHQSGLKKTSYSEFSAKYETLIVAK